jgi:hypothetical protein
MYLKEEIIISFFIITISASNLYMPMTWLYVFLLDFLIPFLCDPDLQCAQGFLPGGGGEGGGFIRPTPVTNIKIFYSPSLQLPPYN